MKQEINKSQFRDAFVSAGRKEQFTCDDYQDARAYCRSFQKIAKTA